MKHNRAATTDATPHVVFSGGGTGGHLFPALAVARCLAGGDSSPRITFAGSGKAFDRHYVEEAGFTFLALPCAPLPRGPLEAARFAVKNLRGIRAARRFIRESDVGLVVGMGGYASVPMARAAVACGAPLVLLEQNAVPGRANRWLAPKARLVCAAFDEVQPYLPEQIPLKITGSPVAEGFAEAAVARQSRSDDERRTLTVLGGSRGAALLNQDVPKALARLGEIVRSQWQIVHQAGDAQVAATQDMYQRLDLRARVVAFVDDMPALLAATDLAVSRAGGATLAELAIAEVPAVLVPYPQAADEHQHRNAEAMTAGGGCRVVGSRRQGKPLDEMLADALREPILDAEVRRSMSAAMARQARPHAAREVADALLAMLPVHEPLHA